MHKSYLKLTYSFMKSWISPISECHMLVHVLHKILDVSQFMVDCDKVTLINTCAHFDSKEKVQWLIHMFNVDKSNFQNRLMEI